MPIDPTVSVGFAQSGFFSSATETFGNDPSAICSPPRIVIILVYFKFSEKPKIPSNMPKTGLFQHKEIWLVERTKDDT